MHTRWVVLTAAVVMLTPTLARAQEAAGVELQGEEQPPTVIEESTSTHESIDVTVQVPPQESAPPAAPARTRRRPLPPEEEPPPPPEGIFLHGFRLGYLYIMNTEGPIDPRDPASPVYAQRYDMRSPHLAMIGYELAWRMIGYDWLNLLLIGNVMIAGLEQSRFFPSINLLLGFEIARMVQIGIGVSVTPTKEEPAHMIFAAGWTPRVGSFYIPLHFFFVPDIAGHHKIGITAGVNFF